MSKPHDKVERALGAVARVGRILTGRQLAGRGVTVFPDDVFLVSYPRSGNTWTRFLLGNLIYRDEPVTFSNIESRLPEIYFNPDRRLRALPRPRMLKSHECFQPHYPHVIYIVRDPRDVAISFYHHNVKARNIPDDYPLTDFVPRFMAGEFDRRFGSWRDNVLSWISVRGDSPNFMRLGYEEMRRDTAGALRRVVVFLEHCWSQKIDSSPEALERAIALSSPERMRDLERKQAASWVLTRNTRSDKSFVGTAKAGGWKSGLAPESVAAIESAWGKLIEQLGYELISGCKQEPVEAISHQEMP